MESAKTGCIYCQMVVLVTLDLKEKHGVDITDNGKGTICLNGGEESREAARCFITASKDDHAKMILLYNAFGNYPSKSRTIIRMYLLSRTYRYFVTTQRPAI